MEKHQIIILLIMVASVLLVGLTSYYNGRRDGERRGNVKAAIFADKVLELEDELRREHDASEQLELSAEYDRAQIRRLTAAAETNDMELAESQRRRLELDDENERLQARLAAELGQVDDLAHTVKEQSAQLAALRRLNETAASVLEITVQELQQAEARALLPADVQHLQHAARQLGQHGAQFRRTGSQKTNHAQVAADHLLQLIQRVQPTPQQSEEPSPRQAA